MKTFNNRNFFLIAGPCVVENENTTSYIAQAIDSICKRLKIHFYFKASYRKANRSSLYSFTGIGDIEALSVLAKVKEQFGLPIVTDIHAPEEAAFAAQVADVLQIPAFLCRQTDLLQAAAKTGKVVNIKKGQFLSPQAMQFAVEKVRAAGNPNVMITERGTSFGYQDLIVDFRGIKELKKNRCPVVLDCTHSLQKPNQEVGVTGGEPELIETLAKAGIATGFDGIFLETHPNPKNALSDGANMLPLSQLEPLLEKLLKIRKAVVNSTI
ncbi:MAG: 3-deoxy-8-phosphooctulonate synthase [Bacteroidales bacterium]|jgi:2-dehydro-3-deoxyphosphooctonate aldolase (KDO 8-P synthase)|nr:3-deoxy-8-phosphooctulonate synthase [Bacteroidales bacterium]